MTDRTLNVLWLGGEPPELSLPPGAELRHAAELPAEGSFDLVIAPAAQGPWDEVAARQPPAIRVAIGSGSAPASDGGCHLRLDDPTKLPTLIEALSGKPVASPVAVLREESDEWAVLFDPDSGDAVGINPTGVAIWNLLDGTRGFGQIVAAIEDEFEEVPEGVRGEVAAFLFELGGRGLVGYALEGQGR